MTYRVIWEIDIEADSPREAAEIADGFRRLSTKPYFTVRDRAGQITDVDLEHYRGDRQISAKTTLAVLGLKSGEGGAAR
jgi:hypothetical protein